jgi:hypothetical protein
LLICWDLPGVALAAAAGFGDLRAHVGEAVGGLERAIAVDHRLGGRDLCGNLTHLIDALQGLLLERGVLAEHRIRPIKLGRRQRALGGRPQTGRRLILGRGLFQQPDGAAGAALRLACGLCDDVLNVLIGASDLVLATDEQCGAERSDESKNQRVIQRCAHQGGLQQNVVARL